MKIGEYLSITGCSAIRNQVVGYLGTHAILALKISTGLNPLAGAAGLATCSTIQYLTTNIFIKYLQRDVALIVSSTLGIVTGAAVYTATATLSTQYLIAVNLIILCASVALTQSQYVFA